MTLLRDQNMSIGTRSTLQKKEFVGNRSKLACGINFTGEVL